MSRGFCLLPMQMCVTLRVWCGPYKNETADGGHRAVSHFQIRDRGIRGMGALIQLRYLRAQMLGSPIVLRDNGTSSLLKNPRHSENMMIQFLLRIIGGSHAGSI